MPKKTPKNKRRPAAAAVTVDTCISDTGGSGGGGGAAAAAGARHSTAGARAGTRASTRAGGHTSKAKTAAIGTHKKTSSTATAAAFKATTGAKAIKKKRGTSVPSEQAVVVACAVSSCGKRANKACKKDRCRGCCVVHKEPCSLHATEATELNEIRDMITRGETPRYNMDKLPAALSGLPVSKGYFLEDAFSRFGETVVLFYLGDFLNKKKFCSEALKSAQRTRRRSRLNGDQFVQEAARRNQANQRHKSLDNVFSFLRARQGFLAADDSTSVAAMMMV